jgi:histone deacetylase 1/2
MNAYGVDTNWYVDTGAMDHLTSDLNKLSMHDTYNGHEQIRTASWTGMNIDHVGHAIVRTPSRNLHLKNVLHVPDARKNLISVHLLAANNRPFLEFHLNFFLIKDQATKKVLLRGKCRGDLYPLPSETHASSSG